MEIAAFFIVLTSFNKTVLNEYMILNKANSYAKGQILLIAINILKN